MLSFDTIDGGELAAQFKRALAEIGRNIIRPEYHGSKHGSGGHQGDDDQF